MSGESVSEWMRIMLEEIARKKAEEEEMRAEEQRRREAHWQHEEPNARSI
ncbi:MAG TPA: hypothetical protein VGN99_15530 [Steroidobacteraceae bacterium]|jgi:hypothetical protein|nr:hypothetical protein [Steroidobacteraceae bacterium]